MTKERDQRSAKQDVQKIIDSLTDRERRILEERFGKIDENFKFDSLKHELEKTRLKIREIEAKALKKLKNMRDVPPGDIA